jgi:galactofuranose transport system permease protein
LKSLPENWSLIATVALFLLLSLVGGIRYEGFLAPQVFLNLLIDNAFLLVVAVGMTFVILTGGIDLSVGAVVAFTTVLLASLVQKHGWHPLPAMAFTLALGTAFGAAMGFVIQRYRLLPFVVTLAGMFLARGAATLISVESIGIDHPVLASLAGLRLPLGGGASLSIGAVTALMVVAIATLMARSTQFGRTVYAIGGSETSAALMGLPVATTLVRVYALSGFCAALAGLIYSFYTLSGYSLHATGLELDAIAAVVIGGTLLSGGVGHVPGTLVGVLVLGLIQTLISFDGTLSSWWTRIVIGMLLLLFCLLQRLLAVRRAGMP